jgi:hypothetical protein
LSVLKKALVGAMRSKVEGRAGKVFKILNSTQDRKSLNLACEGAVQELWPTLLYPAKQKTKYVTAAELKILIEESKHQREFIPEQKRYKNIDDDPVRIVNYALVEYMFKKAGKTRLLNFYQVYERMFDIKTLGSLGDFMKIRGPAAHSDWKIFVDAKSLFGYGDIADFKAVDEYIRGWTQTPFQPLWHGERDDESYYAAFKKASDAIMEHSTVSLPNEVSLETFVSDLAMMGTTGSGFNPDEKQTFDTNFENEQVKHLKNKYTMAASMTVEKKLIKMKQKKPQISNVSQKIELKPKFRLIVSGEFWLSMKMRFVRQWLNRWLAGTGWSTLWSTKEQNWDMWNKSCDFSKGVKVPLDQTKFDWHANKKQLNILLLSIRRVIEKYASDPEMLEVMDAIIVAMQSGKIIFEGHKYDWNNGILSGWDWTAFLDTYMNYVEFQMALEVSNTYVKTTVDWVNVQGDDQNIQTDDWVSALAYWAAMESMNVDVNPTKNFFSSVHNEYLRKGCDSAGLNGYPLRMVNSICWHYPGSPFQQDKIAKLRNIWDNWIKLGERIGADLTELFIEDALGAKISSDIVHKFPNIPKVLGGGGRTPHKFYSFVTSGGQWKLKPTITGAPGYKDFQIRFGEYQSRELENWMLDVAGVADHTKTTELKTEVETILETEKSIDPSPFYFNKLVKLDKTKRIEGYPPDVIMGSGDEFMRKVFPYVDSFVQQHRAPKTWIYDYLTGRTKVVSPPVEGLSEEFASILWSQYSDSIYSAMFTKRVINDKWKRLNYFAELEFGSFVKAKGLRPYKMLG